MHLLTLSFVIIGLASRYHLGDFGWPRLHLDHGGTAGVISKLGVGVHLKFGIQHQPTAPAYLQQTSLDSPSLQIPIQQFIQHQADSLNAEISVAFRDLESGREFFFNERRMVHAASTMKVPVMMEVFRQAEAGGAEPRIRLDDSLLVKNEFKSIVDGSPYSLDVGEDSDPTVYRAIGKQITIRQLVEQMITVSSNLATNILIELVGAENVMTTLRRLGIRNMQVRRGVEDGKAYRLGLNNQTDAFDMMLALQAIAEKRAASAISCDSMVAVMRRQKFRDGIPAGLPSGAVVANKTGSITAIAHDCAIVFPPNSQKSPVASRKPYLLAVLTSGIQDEKAANRMIAAISQKIYHDLILPL